MCGNVDAALLWLRLLDKYSTKECDMTKIQSEFCIFYRKYDGVKLDIVMSVYIDDVFMSGIPETPEKIKEMIKLKFSIKESEKVKKFLGVV